MGMGESDEETARAAANVEANVEEDGGVGEEKEEEEDGEEGVEAEEGGYAFRFEGSMNPMDFTHEDASGLQPYERFERLEYEALAEKKRKALADSRNSGEGSSKKARLKDFSGATEEEIMEALHFGGVRKRSRKKLKKRGRRKGSRKKINPEVAKMLGDATLHYVHGRYEEAISVLNEVIRLDPNLPDSYHTLGLIYTDLGDEKRAMDFYMLTASLKGKDTSLWEQLYAWSIKQGNSGQAKYCLLKAIAAEPDNVSLRFQLASIYLEVGDYQRAAETYEEIQKVFPENTEALITGAKLYIRCRKLEHAIGILENYIKHQSSKSDVCVINLLASIYMDNNAQDKALRLIENEQNMGIELDPKLIVKSGICHLHLGNVEKAESLFNTMLALKIEHDQADLITTVADSYMILEDFHSALRYYLLLKGKCEDCGSLHFKVAQCYLRVNQKAQAISSFYKGLHICEDNVGARITLASLLLEENKEDEAIALLSPPNNSVPGDEDPNKPTPWWEHGKVKLKLCNIYRAKGMIETFADIMFPLVHEALSAEVHHHKAKPKKRLSKRVLYERVRLLDDPSADNVFSRFRPVARSSDLLKASRAKRLLQQRESQKGQLKAVASESLDDLDSDNLEGEDPVVETLQQERAREPRFRIIWKDEEHQCLIVNLCKALASLGRYWEALEIINVTARQASNILPSEIKDDLQSVGTQIAYHTTDPRRGFDWARQIVEKHPDSLVAWNCYYKVISRLEGNQSRHSHFLLTMRSKHPDSVPPIVISGHHFNAKSRSQDASRDYLEAYKLQPDNPLINLCIGTSLINLALGFRLKNKHQCLTQGMAFLFNNMKLTDSSQEAMYNIARAFHHVGLVSFAVLYYEKVLRTREKDYPIPKLPNEEPVLMENLKPGHCDLRREAAYNLHLIYKRSGAHDLARQVLRDHCTF